MKKFNECLIEENDLKIIKENVDNSKQFLMEFLGSENSDINEFLDSKLMRYKDNVRAEIKKGLSDYLQDLSTDIKVG